MTQQLQFSAGKIIFFSEGCYSDFGYIGQVVTLEDLDLHTLKDQYVNEYKPKSTYDKPMASDFVAWLCATQKCAGLDCSEVYCGNYDFEL